MTDRDTLIREAANVVEFLEHLDIAGLRYTNMAKIVRALISLASPSPAQTETIPWTPELERARIELAEFCVRTADDPHCLLVHVDLPKRLLEIEQALTMLGEYAALATLPPPEDERVKGLVERIEKINELYFRPWGAAKGVEWDELSDDRPFNSDTAMAMIDEALASYRGGA